MWYERREVGEVCKRCWIGMIGITSGRKFKRGIHTGESIKKRWVLGVVHSGDRSGMLRSQER